MDSRQQLKVIGVLLLVCFTVGAFLLPRSVAPAEKAFPSKHITWIVPYSPGGGFDTYSRGVARVMAEKLGADIVIKNIPGAGGVVGTSILYRSKPDGYTIGILYADTQVANQIVRKVEFDMRKFAYIGQVREDPCTVSVGASSRFHSVEDLQKAAAEKPIRVAATSMLTSAYTAYIGLVNGLKVQPIIFVSGFQGSSEALTAMARGDADVGTNFSVSSVKPYIESGHTRALCQFALKRSEVLPDVPTGVELGYPEAGRIAAFGMIVAPPGTPRERVAVLEDALMKSLKDPELIAWSKKAERPLTPANAKEAREVVQDLFTKLDKYKGELRKALGK